MDSVTKADTSAEVPSVFLPFVFVGTSAIKFTFEAFKAVPTPAIVSSFSTSKPVFHPLNTMFEKIPLVPLLSFIP
ncbi:hypothetical protein D3C85_1727150 [compost metagenome]